MPYGYPDWRPPGLGAGGRLLKQVELAAAGDIIVAPGAGFRLVLFYINVGSSAAGVLVQTEEKTAGNVLVRVLTRNFFQANGLFTYFLEGVPLAENNKLFSNSAGTTAGFTVIYAIEAI